MNKHYYKEYYTLEREHWWFKARLEILNFFVGSRFPKKEPFKILNAGAATGATSVMLKKHGEVLSLEYDKDCAHFLSEVLAEEVSNASLTDLPFENEKYDLVCAFDVIEHIEDHQKAVQEIYRVLEKDGSVFITVPAYNFLWSKHDDINHHIRRYTKKELVQLLRDAGFKIVYSSYFNFFLFFPIFCVRLLSRVFPQRKQSESTGSDFEKFNSSGVLNRLLFKLFRSELIPLRNNIRFPFGISILIIGRK